MAAILLSDCTVTNTQVGAIKIVKIVTPATADDTDTIDCSTLFSNGCVTFASAATDGMVMGAEVYATTITITGSTDNEARTIIAIGE
jgi:hypothetical protein